MGCTSCYTIDTRTPLNPLIEYCKPAERLLDKYLDSSNLTLKITNLGRYRQNLKLNLAYTTFH
jgi:hypothetical protein